jgi:cell fate regulator YaaT (PSP1 superfamily)
MAMVKYIGVRFKRVGKIYYFSPGDFGIVCGDKVIVETIRGVECGEVVLVDRQIEESELSSPLKTIIRIATKKDKETIERNKLKEKEAFAICEEKIKKHGLKMDLVDVECTFDNNKLLFYFTAENRVDFRELVKDLASVFRTRIELRQIGVRDEAKMLGGLGICGQPFCCSRFLGEFQPVSVKMAKEQSLSLNPTKLSGTCGRLMCCLKYESEAYQDLLKTTPKVGAYVKTAEGKGVVSDVNLLTGILKVKIDKSDNVLTVNKKDVEVIKDSVIKVDKNEMRALKQLEGK